MANVSRARFELAQTLAESPARGLSNSRPDRDDASGTHPIPIERREAKPVAQVVRFASLPSKLPPATGAQAEARMTAPVLPPMRYRYDSRPGFAAFAGFGLPPKSLSDTPAYALRVFARSRILRAGLRSARTRRPQDVHLYLGALRSADRVAVAKGVALMVAAGFAAVLAFVASFPTSLLR